MTELTLADAQRGIIEHTRRLAESAAAAGPGAAVPTAPDWTVTQLVEHIGQTQHWVADIIEQRITDPARLPTEMAALPADPADWPGWLAGSAQRVATACAVDAPVFNAAGDGRSGTRFWRDSMLNEAVVHGADGHLAAARPVDVEPDVAAALIANHFAMLTSPTWAMLRSDSAEALRGSGQTLQWRATDIDAAWLVERGPTGATWRAGTGPADVTVTAPAGVLLLALTRRLPVDDATVEGAADLVRHWIDNTAHVAD